MPQSQTRKLILAALGAIVAAGTLYHLRQQNAHLPGGTACGGHCGTERWSVKTLSDPDAQRIDFVPRLSSVAQLDSLPAPQTLPEDSRIAPAEFETISVRARLVGYKLEEDQDLHLVLADPANPSATLIAEIPSLNCSGACATAYAVDYSNARAMLEGRFGEATPHFERVSGAPVVEVTGVVFFDFRHGQAGLAPNGVELHPVIAIRIP